MDLEALKTLELLKAISNIEISRSLVAIVLYTLPISPAKLYTRFSNFTNNNIKLLATGPALFSSL